MIVPIRKDFDLYKGATFKLQFRLKANCAPVDLTGYAIYMTISDRPDGEEVLSFSTSSSPTYISVDADDDYLITIELPPIITAAISEPGRAYYEIDTVNTDNERDRRLLGNLNIFEQAVG